MNSTGCFKIMRILKLLSLFSNLEIIGKEFAIKNYR